MFLAVMLIVAGAYANELTTTYSTGVAQVVNAGETVLFKVIPIGGDSAANTLTVRTVVFYDNVSVRVSNHPHADVVAFTWVYPVSKYSTDVPVIDIGTIHQKWGYTVLEGKTFSSGMVVSPTAGEKFIFQYKDK